MRFFSGLLVVAVSACGFAACAEPPSFQFPAVVDYGGVAPLPDAAEQPRAGVKVVFDITPEAKPEDVNKGLETVARYLNLNAQAGHKTSDVRIALVLHGGATKVALSDAAYAQHTGAKHNPNSKLLRELKKCGVEVFVCGQSLARNKFAASEVNPDVTIAVSAMTVNINKQLDGYAYLAIH
ncbi:DsrE/DsrF-like family protein [Anatilimnocola aggregata]|uniref:DsrE/DsrF-like family protein n=1 Tax=Anatilimnocola aggregata TaxID=2528021 RepID=A0A517YM61_9BACT|nr:DsrE family protein [Anatilimnocola aggregata]QDU31309.1 DsrE/DsrF-like family protein [Anatilimnocola aggregata]